MDNRPIGVFDSGIGGLSVLRELQKRLPRENFVFFADQKNVPYGEKTKEELVALTKRIMQFLIAQKSKLVVVACNTATCHAIDEMRDAFPEVPIVGVVPAIKLAAEQTKTGSIALIATPATAKSSYVSELTEKFASRAEVVRVGCFGLEDTVETGSLDSPEALTLLESYLSPLKTKNIDQLVLGCTHYPFLKSQISEMLGPSVTLVDSGDAVARRVESLLREKNIKGSEESPSHRFFTNKDATDFSCVASKLLNQSIQGELASV